MMCVRFAWQCITAVLPCFMCAIVADVSQCLVHIVLNKQEAVSCFQELGTERFDGCVSVIVNHVVEKCEESRQLAGTLLLQLVTDDLLTVDQFVNGSVSSMSSPLCDFTLVFRSQVVENTYSVVGLYGMCESLCNERQTLGGFYIV